MAHFTKISLVILLAIAYVQSLGNAPTEPTWESFKKFNRKGFMSALDEERNRQIFEKNAAFVKAHNQAYHAGNVSYLKELNSFADIDPVEFGKRNGFVLDNLTRSSASSHFIPNGFDPQLTIPASFDWRDTNMVSPVKNQGQCGSCWAFSATGAMESQILIGSGGRHLESLSEEQLVECDGYDKGCQGGMYTSAWKYIQRNGGIESEDKYPYTSTRGDQTTCKYKSTDVVAEIIDYVELHEDDEDYVKKTLVSKGPISVAIDASDLSLLSDGIYTCVKSKVQVNHAVLLIGYGTDDSGKDYWLIKNSWGTGWGERGFFKLSRSADGDCGITTLMAYPIVKDREQILTWNMPAFTNYGSKFAHNVDSFNSLLGLVIVVLLLLILLTLRKNQAIAQGSGNAGGSSQGRSGRKHVLLQNEKA